MVSTEKRKLNIVLFTVCKHRHRDGIASLVFSPFEFYASNNASVFAFEYKYGNNIP